MSNFHFDYNDIRKQVAIADLTNEQQKKKRGVSNQQVCCLSCVDRNKNQFLQIVCVGRIWASHIEKTLVPFFTRYRFDYRQPQSI